MSRGDVEEGVSARFIILVEKCRKGLKVLRGYATKTKPLTGKNKHGRKPNSSFKLCLERYSEHVVKGCLVRISTTLMIVSVVISPEEFKQQSTYPDSKERPKHLRSRFTLQILQQKRRKKRRVGSMAESIQFMLRVASQYIISPRIYKR